MDNKEAKVTSTKVEDYVKERLLYMYNLKKKRLAKYWKYRNEYAQESIDTITED